jgi:tyrosyl-tRNA synthetase
MNILDELRWRGLYADCTDLEALSARLATGPMTLYCGFDPTADSLHVGNLVPLLCLRRFQQAGHVPLALAGGATGMIGDPSGRSSERNLLTPEVLKHNIASIKEQLARFLDFDAPSNAARLVDNFDWFGPISYLEFLRDVGKYFTVNAMVAKESVRARMEDRDNGISYTEFSYMLLQAYDFYHLRSQSNCELQIGATDQWGNITAGTELCRKKLGVPVWGLTLPLLTKADGTKYGKSASGAVWLDSKRTSSYRFYQFFVQSDDRDVIKLLKVLTFLPADQIAALEQDLVTNPGARAPHKTLALWRASVKAPSTNCSERCRPMLWKPVAWPVPECRSLNCSCKPACRPARDRPARISRVAELRSTMCASGKSRGPSPPTTCFSASTCSCARGVATTPSSRFKAKGKVLQR